MTEESKEQAQETCEDESAAIPDRAVPEETRDVAREPSEVEQLTAELEAAREEARRNHDLYLREAAEIENYKKRVTREKQDAIRHANESLVRDLLPVIDDLERAAQHAPADGNPQPLLDGIELVLRACLEALQKHGVTQVTAKGEPFDPEKHEAFAQVETAEHEANTVVDEVHRGYYLGDRLLRPSLVSVAKRPAAEAGTPAPTPASEAETALSRAKTPAKQAENTVENDPTDD